MKFSLGLLLWFGALGQPAPTPTPHELFTKAKHLGLDPKTIDQVQPLLEQAAQAWPDVDPRSLEYAQTLTLLGMIKQQQSELDINVMRTDVEPLYKHALAIYNRSVVPVDPLELVLPLELEAAALNTIGQVEEAELIKERALAIRKEHIREMQSGEKAMPAAYQIGNGISAPVTVSRTEPAYTEVARFLKIQGKVILRAIVDEQGVPRDVVLLENLGYGLDENALDAVRNWRFKPGMSGGEPVPVIAKLEVDFHLP